MTTAASNGRPKHANARSKAGQIRQLSRRELCNGFLAEKRKLLGKKTAGDYKKRLIPLIEFAEQPEPRRRWPFAADMGLSKEFKPLLKQVGLPDSVRFYDLRTSCNSEIHLVQRYVTGHTTADILYDYVSLDPVGEMQKILCYDSPATRSLHERAS